MAFWQMAYNNKWVTIEMLRQAVKTDANHYGVITLEEFAEITGENF